MRLQNSVPPTYVNYHAYPYIIYFMWPSTQDLIMRLVETTKSSHLNRTSNLRTSWLKKILLWVSYDSITTRAVPYLLFICVKLETCFMVLAFAPVHSTVWAAQQLPNAHLIFTTPRDKNTSCLWPCTILKPIIYRKFRYLPGYQVDEDRHTLLSSGPVWMEVDGWRVSSGFCTVAIAFQ